LASGGSILWHRVLKEGRGADPHQTEEGGKEGKKKGGISVSQKKRKKKTKREKDLANLPLRWTRLRAVLIRVNAK